MRNKECCKSRRRFIKEMGGLFAVAGVATYSIQSCTKPSEPEETITIDLTDSDNNALTVVGGAMYVENESIIVYRKSDTEAVSFSSLCTHQNNKLRDL